jgi:hypothetical protein
MRLCQTAGYPGLMSEEPLTNTTTQWPRSLDSQDGCVRALLYVFVEDFRCAENPVNCLKDLSRILNWNRRDVQPEKVVDMLQFFSVFSCHGYSFGFFYVFGMTPLECHMPPVGTRSQYSGGSGRSCVSADGKYWCLGV